MVFGDAVGGALLFGRDCRVKRNVIECKGMAFAIRIVRMYQFLMEEKREFVLSKQLLRAGTSIGANVREGVQAFSKNDFT